MSWGITNCKSPFGPFFALGPVCTIVPSLHKVRSLSPLVFCPLFRYPIPGVMGKGVIPLFLFKILSLSLRERELDQILQYTRPVCMCMLVKQLG